MRAQEKTTLKHNGSQLPFYCLMIVVQNCPHAPGLVWLGHTPRMAPQLMGNIIWATHTLLWSCFSNNLNNKILFSIEHGATNYLEPKSSFTHDSVFQLGHRTAHSTRGPGFTLWITGPLMSTGHACILITITKLTDAQSEPGQIWTSRYKHYNELVFHT